MEPKRVLAYAGLTLIVLLSLFVVANGIALYLDCQNYGWCDFQVRDLFPF